MRTDHPHDFVFYVPDFHADLRTIDLTGKENDHMSRVLRMKSGESVHVSNGIGVLARCRIEEIGPKKSTLSVEAIVDDCTDQEPLALALALLKKDAYERAVEQCAELGVTHFLPFVAAASHIKNYSQAHLERLRRIALSAMKQSFRAVLPAIEEPIAFDDLVKRAKHFATVVVGEAGAMPPAPAARRRPILMVVGPEAGLSAAESERLVGAGAEPVSISDHRLRSETAAVVMTGLFAPRRDRD